jgi:hypothetical protein
LWFIEITRQGHNESKMTRGTQLKQVLDEACKNAKSCNMTTTPPLKSAKNVHKEKQHGGTHFKL